MKLLLLRSIALAALTLGISSVAAAGTVKVSIHDGRVTVVAEDAPLRQILDEWARVGQTRMVNADKVFGPAVTLQLVDVPEREALDTLLRSVSGYIAAPRSVAIANASMYDRITIMPTSHTPATTAAAPVTTFQRPPMQRDDDDLPVNMMQQEQAQEFARQQQLQRAQQAPTSPVLMPYPGMQTPAQGQQGQQQQVPVTSPRPGMPVATSPVPGASPQQQPFPPNPNQPSVVRPVGPGGPGAPVGPGGPGRGGN